MAPDTAKTCGPKGLTRRDFLWSVAGGLALGGAGGYYLLNRQSFPSVETFIARVDNYNDEIAAVISAGFKALGISAKEIKGKRILLKPNLVEIFPQQVHVNTHPLVVRGAIEAFLKLGAAQVLVGEGPGHMSDSLMVLDGSGLGEVLYEDRIPFVDLNNDSLYTLTNRTAFNGQQTLTFPTTLKQVDWIVSLAKMKTHHWAGVTLSMKNLFGVMPGCVYGWPKNVLHMGGIEQSIVDINATLKPHFSIVDGIMGMEGDGPIMGDPVKSGVLVMGKNLAAVDATCCRVMGIDPQRIGYLSVASTLVGPIEEKKIVQRGESILGTQKRYKLLPGIPAQKKLIET